MWEGPVAHTNTVGSPGASRQAAHDVGVTEPRDSVPKMSRLPQEKKN